MSHFSGSYQKQDVQFLLKPMRIATTAVAEKESLIQSGRRHYSEMLVEEETPTSEYLELFHDALNRYGIRLAKDLASLAKSIRAKVQTDEIVIVSLARAGTPIGVLLHRAFKYLSVKSAHYSVSIIRDRGIDAVALDYIIQRHDPQSVVFVDGWTGKGAIADELTKSIGEYNESRGVAVDPSLAVLADLAGVADLAATADDYLIPSSILNAVGSGLISRSVLNEEHVGPGDFHACAFYEHMKDQDLSRYFINCVHPLLIGQLLLTYLRKPKEWDKEQRRQLKETSDKFVADTMSRYNITDRNRVKPGIGESTRALLRRLPRLLILRDVNDEDVKHLVLLAERKSVEIEVDPNLPYRAAVIIQSLGK